MNDVSKQVLQPIGRTSRAIREVRPSQREVLLARVLLHLHRGIRVPEDMVAAVEDVADVGGE